MASASSMSVSIECVNVCKLSKGEGSGRNDCSMFTCAWKAPRVLTGFLASTAHSPQCNSLSYGQNGRRNHMNYRCESSDIGGCYSTEASDFVLGKLCKSGLLHSAGKRWQQHCSTSSSEISNGIHPEGLWEDLKPSISYLLPEELELVHNALKLAFEAHDGQKRRSGEPFIIHPVEVARILGELVSKLGKLKCKGEHDSVQDVKADDMRQMLLAMTEEVRVIIVKLADRLHNMRTLSHMPPHKQSSIARETLQVFAPLSKLLGMYQIKLELENLSFMYTNPEDYAKIRKKVAELYKEHEKEIVEFLVLSQQNTGEEDRG